jgi:hypothetical protein
VSVNVIAHAEHSHVESPLRVLTERGETLRALWHCGQFGSSGGFPPSHDLRSPFGFFTSTAIYLRSSGRDETKNKKKIRR